MGERLTLYEGWYRLSEEHADILVKFNDEEIKTLIDKMQIEAGGFVWEKHQYTKLARIFKKGCKTIMS